MNWGVRGMQNECQTMSKYQDVSGISDSVTCYRIASDHVYSVLMRLQLATSNRFCFKSVQDMFAALEKLHEVTSRFVLHRGITGDYKNTLINLYKLKHL